MTTGVIWLAPVCNINLIGAILYSLLDNKIIVYYKSYTFPILNARTVNRCYLVTKEGRFKPIRIAFAFVAYRFQANVVLGFTIRNDPSVFHIISCLHIKINSAILNPRNLLETFLNLQKKFFL